MTTSTPGSTPGSDPGRPSTADGPRDPAGPAPADPEQPRADGVPVADASASDASGTGEPPAGSAGSTEATGSAEPADAETEPEAEAKPKSFWRELPVLVVVALALAFLIKTFLVQAFYIPSESMENTLLVGDRVLVNKLAYQFGEVERGDVIVFDGRGSFERQRPSSDDGNAIADALRAVASSFGLAPGAESDYIKRVIGVGGDHVVCCDADGAITVNGVPLVPEDYLFPGDVPSTNEFDITVPEGRLWVMGDHRARSADSRSHTGAPGGGTISVDRVIGRAFVKVWPIGRWDTMPRPAVFEDIPDPQP